MKYERDKDHQIILARTNAGRYLQKRGITENAVVYCPYCGVGDTEEIDDFVDWLFDNAREYERSHPNHVEMSAPWILMIDDPDDGYWVKLMRLIDKYEERSHEIP